jgi:hypothetical protein
MHIVATNTTHTCFSRALVFFGPSVAFEFRGSNLNFMSVSVINITRLPRVIELYNERHASLIGFIAYNATRGNTNTNTSGPLVIYERAESGFISIDGNAERGSASLDSLADVEQHAPIVDNRYVRSFVCLEFNRRHN